MKVNCLDGFRCREHCQKHCYKEDGTLWPEHAMFCSIEDWRDEFREMKEERAQNDNRLYGIWRFFEF